MLDNVTQILELSRLKSNKLTYNIAPFNAKEAIIEVVEKHQALALQHGVTITFDSACNEHACSISSDVFRLKQIASNILSNAIKYSHGEVLVSTECSRGFWALHVEDNGDGIKDKEAVFNLFEQSANDIKTRAQEGTGIGLTFVKLLCEELGFTYTLSTSKTLGGLDFTLIKQ